MESTVQNEDFRISSLRALIQEFQACEHGKPHLIQPARYGLYYVLANGVLGYLYEQHLALTELQLKKSSLEEAEEQNQTLRDEVGRLKMEILSFAVKLREAQHRDPIYIENWLDLSACENESRSGMEKLQDACSESTGTLKATCRMSPE